MARQTINLAGRWRSQQAVARKRPGHVHHAGDRDDHRHLHSLRRDFQRRHRDDLVGREAEVDTRDLLNELLEFISAEVDELGSGAEITRAGAKARGSARGFSNLGSAYLAMGK